MEQQIDQEIDQKLKTISFAISTTEKYTKTDKIEQLDSFFIYERI